MANGQSGQLDQNLGKELMMSEEERIVSKTLAGILQAQKDYRNWSNGCNLCDAPEYMITTSVCRKLMSIRGRTFNLTLENNIRNTNRRFDIVIWNGDSPRAAIEIKKIRNRFRPVRRDLNRILETLNLEEEFEFGLVAYYLFGDCRERLQKIMNRIDESAQEEVAEEVYHFESCRRPIREIDGFFWSAAVLKISR